MKIWYFFSPFLIFFLLSACQKEEVQVRVEYPDLNLEYFDYFNRNIPTHIARKGRIIIKHENSVIEDDSIANNYAALGRILFYDTQLSKNNLISCATCHQQSLAFADGLKVSTGLFGEKTTRNSMALVNLGFQRNFFWDISGRSLEEDVMKPIQNHIEMGIENLENLAHKLEETYYYPPLFQETFHTSTIEKEHISSALAAFVKSLYTYNSKYDQGVIKNFTNFTRSEVAGMDLFFGKANCGSCHAAPHFIPSWGGVGNIGLELDYEDEGAGDGRFKIPSLRNIELTAPYMHDGRFATLENVINHYDHGIKLHKHLSWELMEENVYPPKPKRLNLSDHEKQDLIAFLKTLTDESMLKAERFSDPF